MKPIDTIDRVLLIDDQAIVGEAVRRMIAAQMTALGGACEYRSVQDPQQAIAAAMEFKPTVILQDIEMPGSTASSCCRCIAPMSSFAMCL